MAIAQRTVIAFGVAAALVVGVAAKGPTTKVVVAGPGLAKPVTLTSGPAIKPNIWAGGFYGGAAAAPNGAWPRYTVSFFAEAARQEPRVYVVTYVRDPHTAAAVVYFPGRGEADYRRNVFTITRGVEGTWRTADPAWSAGIASVLPKR